VAEKIGVSADRLPNVDNHGNLPLQNIEISIMNNIVAIVGGHEREIHFTFDLIEAKEDYRWSPVYYPETWEKLEWKEFSVIDDDFSRKSPKQVELAIDER
jgi:hypothetical protein